MLRNSILIVLNSVIFLFFLSQSHITGNKGTFFNWSDSEALGVSEHNFFHDFLIFEYGSDEEDEKIALRYYRHRRNSHIICLHLNVIRLKHLTYYSHKPPRSPPFNIV